MEHRASVVCKACGSTMVFLQRRGSSEGQWICPVCARTRRAPLSEVHELEDEEGPRPSLVAGISDSSGRQDALWGV